jgi:hypothetical protein
LLDLTSNILVSKELTLPLDQRFLKFIGHLQRTKKEAALEKDDLHQTPPPKS